jgi:SAM-dependent methyltransferase
MAYTPKVRLVTEFPVAYESLDHQVPWGTSRDNGQNPVFNAKLYRLFSALKRPLRVLDLGCSGGGFIRDCNNDGCLGVGIEGSDYSKNMKRAAWAYLGDAFLFTADISRPFRVTDGEDGNTIKFDVITSWEVLEHLEEHQISGVVENIKSHLLEDGIFVGSISYVSDFVNEVELHRTIKAENWWLSLFKDHGLYEIKGAKRYFNTQYVRGPKQSAPGSFHVCLSLREGMARPFPKLGIRERMLDAWYFSFPHRAIRRLVTLRR